MQDYITLSRAAELTPGHFTYNALWRWCRRGIKARSGKTVKLQHRRIGGQVFTTAKALDEFLTVLNRADSAYFGNESGGKKNG